MDISWSHCDSNRSTFHSIDLINFESEVVSIIGLFDVWSNAPDFLKPHVEVAIVTEGSSLLIYGLRYYYEAHVHVGIESALQGSWLFFNVT